MCISSFDWGSGTAEGSGTTPLPNFYPSLGGSCKRLLMNHPHILPHSSLLKRNTHSINYIRAGQARKVPSFLPLEPAT